MAIVWLVSEFAGRQYNSGNTTADERQKGDQDLSNGPKPVGTE
jgi:hypothetical protein